MVISSVADVIGAPLSACSTNGTRQVWHKSARITTHYSGAELQSLIEASNRVCGEVSRKTPALVVLKRA
jgi:hypothetical protein